MNVLLNQEYANADNYPLFLDIYLPDNSPGLLPVVLYLHGGGWRTGSKDNPAGLFLVEEGYALVSANYRLSGIAPFPAQIHDCKAAVRWIRANADRYGWDPARVGVFGVSAGGHLAALLGTTTGRNDTGFDQAHNNQEFSSEVQAVVNICGPTDFLADGDSAPLRRRTSPTEVAEADATLAALFGGPLHEKEYLARTASPVTWVHPHVPPFLLVHGEQDEIVPLAQSLLLHDALIRAGAHSTLVQIPEAGHGFTPEQREIVTGQVRAFLQTRLKGNA
ncbi:MAG: hypothetical protein OHK0029_14100 [Armatimonadaceae bacterium]